MENIGKIPSHNWRFHMAKITGYDNNDQGQAYTLIDLFAGAGGFTKGFVDTDFSPVYAVEHNRAAAETYKVNFGDHCDVRNIEEIKDFPNVDFII